jgi:hypothetical protein
VIISERSFSNRRSDWDFRPYLDGEIKSLVPTFGARCAVLFVVLIIEPGEPGRQPLHRRLEFRMKVNERLELSSEPPESDFVIPSPRLELLNTPISEIHEPVSYASAASIKARCCCR